MLGGREFHHLGIESLALLFEEIYVDGVYDVDLPRNPRIMDVGANIGLATVFLSGRHPGSQIDAFEPEPSAFDVLQRNIIDVPGVQAHRVALGGADGESILNIDRGHPGSLHASLVSRHHLAQSVVVPLRRLSHYFDGPVDLLKMDVEGSELPILAELAASGALRQVKLFLIEALVASDKQDLDQILALLNEAGFVYRVAADFAVNKGWQDVMIRAELRA